MNRPGDWNCRACHYLNFQRRDSCQKCGDPKPRGPIHDQHYGVNFRGISGSSSPSFLLFGNTTAPGPDVRPGDWYCHLNDCGTHNFANRSTCFKCGSPKDDLTYGGGGLGLENDMARARGHGIPGGGGGGSSSGSNSRVGWKSGDWICSRLGCHEHNFASRTECFSCNAPRELFGSSWSSHS